MKEKSNLENIKKQLKKHGQGHLLAFLEQLGINQQQKLLDQIEQLDLAKIDGWVTNYVKKNNFSAVPEKLEPAPSYSHTVSTPQLQEKYDKAGDLGKQIISEGKVAAFVVAGGQGTRLGFDGPKGNFPISPIKNKTLFQLFAEHILSASEKYNTNCPWYIMTSSLNHEQTKEIFRSNHYYGLDEKDVFIFQQGTLPNFRFDGKILLAEKDTIACSPDGHGGSLKALYESGAVDDMKKRGVEFISYFQVDNPLINIFDTLFIGLHVLDEAEMSSKAIIKTGPMEKVGNFCLTDGKIAVIEYSDLPDEQAQRKNPDGSLVFGLGSIAVHVINRSFVEKLNVKGFSLPLHRAVKKIPYLDADGNRIEPDEPNGIKLESFVFDALPLASKSVILQTIRNEEFAPAKNATGPDSTETTRQMLIERTANWLEAAGIAVPQKADGSPDCTIEIAPSFALEKDNVKSKACQIGKIKPGDEVYLA